MRVQPASHLHCNIPAIVVTTPFVTTAQVLTMAKESSATVGNHVAVNFTEHLAAVRLYCASSLESALRKRRIEEATKKVQEGQTVNVRIQIGTKEVRREFTGILHFVDRHRVYLTVETTKDCRRDQVLSHREPFAIAVRRVKVAWIDVIQ